MKILQYKVQHQKMKDRLQELEIIQLILHEYYKNLLDVMRLKDHPQEAELKKNGEAPYLEDLYKNSQEERSWDKMITV